MNSFGLTNGLLLEKIEVEKKIKGRSFFYCLLKRLKMNKMA